MLPRFKTLAILTFLILALYVVFWREETPFQSGQHAVDVLKGTFGDVDVEVSHEVPQPQDTPPVSLETKLPEADNGYLKDLELEPKPSPTPTPTKSAHRPYFTELPSEEEEDDTPPPEWEPSAEETETGQETSANESTEPPAVAETGNDYSDTGLQVQFDKEYAALGL